MWKIEMKREKQIFQHRTNESVEKSGEREKKNWKKNDIMWSDFWTQNQWYISEAHGSQCKSQKSRNEWIDEQQRTYTQIRIA